jgi:hypothetical protein
VDVPYLNDPDPAVDPNTLGLAVLKIEEPSFGAITGTIGDTDWSLSLRERATMEIFQGTGNVGGEPWIYDYHARGMALISRL